MCIYSIIIFLHTKSCIRHYEEYRYIKKELIIRVFNPEKISSLQITIIQSSKNCFCLRLRITVDTDSVKPGMWSEKLLQKLYIGF